MNKFTYIKESQQTYLDDNEGGKGFHIDKYGDGNSIQSLNKNISEYINNLYGPFGFQYGKNIDLDIDGEIINGEYISKMINNHIIWKTFIREKKITDSDTFYKLLLSSFSDVYNYNGDFFRRQTLPILINTTRKGNINEQLALAKFREVARSKGLNFAIMKPTVEEDINGIDGKFNHGGKLYTIQVKPFSGVDQKGSVFYVKSPGSLSLGVNYLILYNDNKQYIILKNPDNNKIRIDGSYFVYNSKNILFS